MRLTGIKIDDVVQADVRGQRFFATVQQVDETELHVEPVCNIVNGSTQINYHRLTARQVVGHYRRAAGSK